VNTGENNLHQKQAVSDAAGKIAFERFSPGVDSSGNYAPKDVTHRLLGGDPSLIEYDATL
jgi:hypothetical protein